MELPIELTSQDTWLNIKFENGKKIPCHPDQTYASVTGKLYSYETVMRSYTLFSDIGVGYVFTNNGIVGIDIDKATESEILYFAQVETYVERSVSGKGVHIFTTGEIPGKRRRNGRYEIYQDRRIFVMTGARISSETSIKPIDIASFYSTYIEPTVIGLQEEQPQTVTDITQTFDKLFFNDKFMKLYNGYIGEYGSLSEAELAFCSIASKYTKNIHEIDSLMRTSKLFRPKWTSRRGNTTYGLYTIQKVL